VFLRALLFLLTVSNLAVGGWLWHSARVPDARWPSADAGYAELKLLSETAAPSEALSSASLSGGARSCFTIGPFRSQAEARNANRALRDLVLDTRRRADQEERETSWRVFLPPTPSRDAALEQARELAAANVTDYYVVTSGTEQNSISLGVYRTEANATRRLAALRQAGFNAQMDAQSAPVQVFWLDYALSEGGSIEWRSVLKPGAELRQLGARCF
jgi:hypothetical protein